MIKGILTQGELKSALEGNTAFFKFIFEEGVIYIMQRGGRVIGGFFSQKDNEPNVFWTHPELKKVLKEEPTQWNLGGERLWVGREQAFHYHKPKKFLDWFCPLSLDPGNYQILFSSHEYVILKNQFDLIEMLSGFIFKDICVIRKIEVFPNPYPKNFSDITYIGIRIYDFIEILTFKDPKINPWNLTQIYPGDKKNRGFTLIPTKEKATPIIYMEEGGDITKRIKKFKNCISFITDQEGIFKIAISPEDSIIDEQGYTKIAHLSKSIDSNKYLLIVKRSNTLPKEQEEIFDLPKVNPLGPRGAIQTYSGPAPTNLTHRFAEIELQCNPLKNCGNKYTAETLVDILFYQGEFSKIKKLAEKILNIKELPLF